MGGGDKKTFERLFMQTAQSQQRLACHYEKRISNLSCRLVPSQCAIRVTRSVTTAGPIASLVATAPTQTGMHVDGS